jgi:hypothetical protein
MFSHNAGQKIGGRSFRITGFHILTLNAMYVISFNSYLALIPNCRYGRWNCTPLFF